MRAGAYGERLEAMALFFEWDPAKAEANFRKHGISFDEASSAFFDEMSITIRDPLHSGDEERLYCSDIPAAIGFL